jgi:hypothetical protein
MYNKQRAMKTTIFLLIWICNWQLTKAQTTDTVLDEVVRIDPNTLQERPIELEKIKIPERLQTFTGIRFVDIRPYQPCIGFAKLLGENKKIVPIGGLDYAIHSKLVPNNQSGAGDSLIVFIRHFWESRLKKTQIYWEDDNEDDLKKPSEAGVSAFCHVTAVSFFKNKQGLFYCGKLDTVLTNNRMFAKSYDAFPGKVVEFLLDNLAIANSSDRPFTEEQIRSSIAKPVAFAAPENMPNGFFMTYGDFKKGKLVNKPFTLATRVYGYKIIFANEADETAMGDSFWGLCYQNQFYINRSLIVNKLIKSGDTYLAMCGSWPSWKNAAPSGLITKFILPDLSRIGYNEKINKYTKKRSDFFPLLLNPLTGYLE